MVPIHSQDFHTMATPLFEPTRVQVTETYVQLESPGTLANHDPCPKLFFSLAKSNLRQRTL